MDREEILRLLRDHLDEIRALFGVRSLRLFGSTAREEAQPSSDVDILVGFQDTPTFRGYMQLRIYLEDLLGANVDLITEGGLRDAVRPYVERDVICVA